MSGSIYSWSTAATDNDDADGDINWKEGQNAKTVNGSARQMMGRVAELLLDLGGQGTVGGTANAITLTLESSFTSLTSGLMCALQPTADNTGAVTLNVNGIGAKSIRKFDTTGEADLAAGDLQSGGFYLLIYDSGANSSAGAWIALNPTLTKATDSTKLNGQAASYYLNAGNMSGGTLPDARLPTRLGVTSKTVTDWDDATAPGFYTGAPTAANAPNDTDYFIGIVRERASGVHVTQDLVAYDGDADDTKSWRRVRLSSTWGDWFRLRVSQTEQAALWAALTDLASTDNAKGASLIGVEDSDDNFTGTTVEAVLAELAGFNTRYVSSEQSITKAGSGTLAHGLGDEPSHVSLILVCQTAEFGYSVGDRLRIAPGRTDGTNNAFGVAITTDDTNIKYKFYNSTAVFCAINFSDGSAVNLTSANWKMVVVASL